MHDIQVIINAANYATRYQEMQQFQTHVAQTHMAIRLNSDVEVKRTQIQETAQEREIKSVEDREEHLRQWKKENFEKKEFLTEKKEKDIKVKKLQSSNIIDILI